MKPRSSHSIKSKIEFSALSHVACWDGDGTSGGDGEREGSERSLNLLTFTPCCGIKPCGQDRTLTRLSRDDKLAVLPDAWLPDLYSLSGGGGEEESGEGDSGKWCPCQWGACAGNAHFTLSISIPNEHDGNAIQSSASFINLSTISSHRYLFVFEPVVVMIPNDL